MAADGSATDQITTSSDDDYYPRWSPDGQKIAFARNTADNFDVWVANADGSGAVNLTNNAAWDDYPSWSPDGQKLLFSSTRGDGDFEIWVMDADGTDPVQLTSNDVDDDYPAWSPDGQRVAYMSGISGQEAEIWVMNADGSSAGPLFSGVGVDWYPAWSPDGMKIAFTSDRTGSNHVYVMNADGSGQTQLTTEGPENFAPAWSPDGSQIAFTSNRDGNPEIYRMAADGANQTRVTTNPAFDGYPDWNAEGNPGGGTVGAQVTIPASAACIELSTTSVDFGTLPLGSIGAQGDPNISVASCSGVTQTYFARGTDAIGAGGGAWALDDSSATCADSLGVDKYHLTLKDGGSPAVWQLSTTNKPLMDVQAGVVPFEPTIDTACPGSTGSGTTMSMQIVFLATTAE